MILLLFPNPLADLVAIILLVYCAIVGYALYLSPQAKGRQAMPLASAGGNHDNSANRISMRNLLKEIEEESELSQQQQKKDENEYQTIEDIANSYRETLQQPEFNAGSVIEKKDPVVDLPNESDYLPLISEGQMIDLNAVSNFTETEERIEEKGDRSKNEVAPTPEEIEKKFRVRNWRDQN